MKILMLTPVVPSPFRGRRPYNFLRALAATHQVRVLALPFQQGTQDDARHLEAELGVEVRLLPQSTRRSLANCALAPFMPHLPLRVLYCRHGHIRRALREEARDWKPDVIHLDRERLAQYALDVPDIATVADLPDAMVMYHKRLAAVSESRWERAMAWYEGAAMRRYERWILPRVGAGLVCSRVDRDYIADYVSNARLEVITNAVDTQQFAPRSRPTSTPPRLIFTGTLSYRPNLDGLKWYLEQVAPLLERMGVPARPTIAGVSWNKSLVSAVLQDRDVESLGFVERLEDLLTPNDLYLCPLRIGAGIRNKLLEAMASGMACVSTTLGHEGMTVQAGTHLLTGDTPQAFAEAVAHAHADVALRRRLGQAARDYVTAHHDLRVVGTAIEDLYNDLARS